MTDIARQAGSGESATKADVWPLTDQEVRIIRRWWIRLTQTQPAIEAIKVSEGWPEGADTRPFPNGVRARLRRCATPEAAMLSEGFRLLWSQREQLVDSACEPPRWREEALLRWACIALVLADLRSEQSESGKNKGPRPLGECLGSKTPSTDQPMMSELRLERLMRVRDPAELAMRLRRALGLVRQRGVCALSIARLVALWFSEQRTEAPMQPTRRYAFVLANDYFKASGR